LDQLCILCVFDWRVCSIERQFLVAAKAMPADQYSFAPAQGIFAPGQTRQFDTVRSFVAQVTHLPHHIT
jgi:hypothetical protein